MSVFVERMTRGREKTARLKLAVSHSEPDRVPVGEFFWTGFMKRCEQKWGLGFDPYRHFDLDYIVVTPNMDPIVRPFEILSRDAEDIVVRTGFGATIRRSGTKPMPHYETFSVRSPEEMADFEFDDPADPRRFYEGGDDQINGVGDALIMNLPPWSERVDSLADDFSVFGSVCDPYEYLWRCIGTENALYWMATDPHLLEGFVDEIGEWLLDFTEAQIEAGSGRLAGMYIWGDVAYKNGMLFGAPRWRELFKPRVRRIIELCHRNGLMVFYHGCGNATDIFEDLVDIGLDCYNPLESKAGLDVVEMKKRFSGRMAFCGNIDVRVLERGNPDEIRAHVIYTLQAARGGGYVMQSDHSVSSDVSPESYELAIRTLRECGNYPLDI